MFDVNNLTVFTILNTVICLVKNNLKILNNYII